MDVSQTSLWGTSVYSLDKAVHHLVERLYRFQPLPQEPISNKTPRKAERNAEIQRRLAEGERIVDLANEYGISEQRVDQIRKLGNQQQ